MEQLYTALKEAGLLFNGHTEIGELDFILCETYEDETTNLVDVSTFKTLFGDVEANPTYECLSGFHPFNLKATQYIMTAEEMGYQKYFD